MFKNVLNLPIHEIALFKGKLWLKVFAHKYNNTNDCFSNESEARHNIEENKFSILDEINESMRINGKYEFIIEYPNEYFHWRQSSNPLEETEIINKNAAEGFVSLHNGTEMSKWGGLVKSSINISGVISSFLEGNPGNDWWMFSIGMYCNIRGWDTKKGIPGSVSGVPSVRLWVRINHFGLICSRNIMKRSFNVNAMLMLILVS